MGLHQSAGGWDPFRLGLKKSQNLTATISESDTYRFCSFLFNNLVEYVVPQGHPWFWQSSFGGVFVLVCAREQDKRCTSCGEPFLIFRALRRFGDQKTELGFPLCTFRLVVATLVQRQTPLWISRPGIGARPGGPLTCGRGGGGGVVGGEEEQQPSRKLRLRVKTNGIPFWDFGG